MRFLFFFLIIFFFPRTTSASYVVPYSSVEKSRLVQTPLPTASSDIISELEKCEKSKPEIGHSPCGYVYSAPYDLELLTYQGECKASKLTNFPCQYVDSSSSSVIVEWCQDSSSFKPGLYIFRGNSGAWYYPWFDANTMDFACKYRDQVTEEPDYYGFAPNKELGFHSLFYQYYVNLTSGHTYFLLLPDSKIRVLEWVDEALPS